MSSRPSICVIGSLNVDFVYKLPRMPEYHETLAPNSICVNPGGRGVIQAMTCAKLSRTKANRDDPSVDVRMVGAVGDDKHGTVMINNLRENGIDTSGVKVLKGLETGYNINLQEEVPDTGDYCTITAPNANKSHQASDFTDLGLPLPSLFVLQMEIPLDAVLQILKAAKKAKVPVLLKPAPTQDLPKSAYRRITHLVISQAEAAVLAKWDLEYAFMLSEMPDLAKHFLELGVENVVITLHVNGAYYANQKGEAAFVPGYKVNVVDRTTVGNIFVGAYAVSIVKGADLPTAVRRANKASSISISRHGAIPSIPWADEVEEL